MLYRSALVAVLLTVPFALGACGEAGPLGEATPETATSAAPTVSGAQLLPPVAATTPTETAAMAPIPVESPSAEQVEGALLGQATEPLTTVEVVKRLTPSVVHVATQRLTVGMLNQPIPLQGVGTGIVVDEEGHILTNNHVVAGAERIIVTLNTGESYPAVLVGGDSQTDTAIVRIEGEGLHPAMLGDSSAIEVGQDVIAIGHALGLAGGPTVSKGVVSALGRSIDTNPQTTMLDLIQTDASINPGNSGGPLVNSRGEVVGINTAIIKESQGIGFAINIDDAKEVATQLIEEGTVERGFIGITPVNLTPAVISQLDLRVTPDVEEGILILRVYRGTGAESAGLLAGDIIVRLGDEAISNTGEMSRFLMRHLPGETVDVAYVRGTTQIATQITLGERPTG